MYKLSSETASSDTVPSIDVGHMRASQLDLPASEVEALRQALAELPQM